MTKINIVCGARVTYCATINGLQSLLTASWLVAITCATLYRNGNVQHDEICNNAHR